MTNSRRAVLIIDLQRAMFDGRLFAPIHDAAALETRVQHLLAWARGSRVPVAFIQHHGPSGHPLAPDAPGWPIWPPIAPTGAEPVFAKSAGDAFANPDLGGWLAQNSVNAVVLAGAQSDHCVRATALGALNAGLEVAVVSDAHSTWASEREAASAISQRINAELSQLGVLLIDVKALSQEV